MERSKALEIVKGAICEHEFITIDDLQLASTLEGLGISSLDKVEIAMLIEGKITGGVADGNFDAYLGKVNTVEDMVKMVEKYA